MSGSAWIVLGLVLLVLEVLTPGVFFLFFGAAAIVVGLFALVGDSTGLALQLAAFSVLSIASLLAFRGPLLRRLHARRSDRAPVDSVVGATAIARETMQPGAAGQVEFRGTVWEARNAGGSALAPGTHCRVVKLEGLTLWVEPEGPS